MTAAQQLVSVDDISESNAPSIYVQGGLKPFIEQVRAEVSAEVPDLSTRKGRERIASLAAKVSKSKVAVEKPGRDYLKKLKEMPKVVEAELREFVRDMDALRDETRRPLTEWEAAEAARVAGYEAAIAGLADTATEGMSAAEIGARIQALDVCEIGADWEEFEPEANRVKAASLATLREALAAREKCEAEQAELEELRRKQAEQEQKDREAAIAREAEERARREAEQLARAEREAAAKREADAKAAAEQARLNAELSEQRRIAAEKQAELDRKAAIERERIAAEQAEQSRIKAAEQAAAAERRRIADEQAEIERQAKAREADIAHKTAVLTSIKESFMQAGITEDQAKAIVNMIRKGDVPSVSIQY